jgi:DNA-binding transcriptional LysR family regulator
MYDHLKSLVVFWHVAHSGSFRGAAKALRLSPSVVSHHVSVLESYLGTALLYRSTRRLSLTDDGRLLFATAGEIVAAADAGLGTIMRRTEQLSGRLRVAAAGAVFQTSPYFDFFVGFLKEYPRVEMSVSFSDQKIELLGSDFDVALRVGWPEDSHYKSRKLIELERVIVASPDYLATRSVPRTVNDMSGWRWIKLAQLPLKRQLSNRQGEVASIDLEPVMEVDSVSALCTAVRSGIGAAALPRILVHDDLKAGQLVALSPDWPLMPAPVHAVWPANVVADSLPLHFVHFIAEKLAKSRR